MAEQLGDALLKLRTDDTEFTGGVDRAEGKARKMGATFDQASAKSGNLGKSLGQTGKAAASAGTQFERVTNTVRASAGAQRAGLQQLQYQIGDVATMYALGAKPATIFASQIGQVTQAIQLATGGASRFAAFLGGPWGMALTTAVIVLSPFIGKLFEADRAAEMAEEGANALANAQSSLGDVFDLVSGKLKTQNELLLVNARLMAANLRADALTKRAGAKDTLVSAQQTSNVFQASLGSEAVRAGATANARAVQQLLKDIASGKVSREQAIKQSESMDFSGTRVTGTEFREALRDAVVANLNERVASLIDQSLDEGVLAEGLRQPAKPKKAAKRPKDRSAEIADRKAAEMAKLDQEELQARLDLATNIDERAELQYQLLGLERDERIRQINADKDLDAKEKAARIAYIEKLYGKDQGGADGGDITVNPNTSPYGIRIQREYEEKQAALANDALARQAEGLRAQASITTNLKDRDALENRALELQQEIERNLLEQDIANGRVADADQARALLAEKQVAQRKGQLAGQLGPLAAYREAIRQTAENMDTEIQAIEVDGLKSLNEQLADAVLGAKSLGDVFHDVAGQIVRDLLRIAIQRSLIEPLANALIPGGGGSGLFTSLLGGIGGVFGIGGPTNLLPAGYRAGGGPVDAGRPYVVGERGPEVIVPRSAGHVVPNGGLGGAGRPIVQVLVRKGEVFEAEVQRISGDVTAQVLTEAGPVLVDAAANETARRLTRPRI